jgi:hypothetical protein
MFRRISFILLNNKNVPINDYESFKLINNLSINMDQSVENKEDFKNSVLKLMHNLIEFNKYISQRIDELFKINSRRS